MSLLCCRRGSRIDYQEIDLEVGGGPEQKIKLDSCFQRLVNTRFTWLGKLQWRANASVRQCKNMTYKSGICCYRTAQTAAFIMAVFIGSTLLVAGVVGTLFLSAGGAKRTVTALAPNVELYSEFGLSVFISIFVAYVGAGLGAPVGASQAVELPLSCKNVMKLAQRALLGALQGGAIFGGVSGAIMGGIQEGGWLGKKGCHVLLPEGVCTCNMEVVAQVIVSSGILIPLLCGAIYISSTSIASRL